MWNIFNVMPDKSDIEKCLKIKNWKNFNKKKTITKNLN